MSCDQFDKLGFLYLYGELDELERTDFERHLVTCEACRQELAQSQAVIRLLSELPLEKPDEANVQALLSKAFVRPRSVLSLSTDVIRALTRVLRPKTTPAWLGAVATAVISIVVVLSFSVPWHCGENAESRLSLFQWDDQFFAATEILHESIESLSHGQLPYDFSTASSTLSDDFSDIISIDEELLKLQQNLEELYQQTNRSEILQ